MLLEAGNLAHKDFESVGIIETVANDRMHYQLKKL
jgi:hypothetical protein